MHALLNLACASTSAKQSYKSQILQSQGKENNSVNNVSKIHNQLACGTVDTVL
jgi:hypothetical protein